MTLPFEDRFRVRIPEIKKVYSGFDKFFHNFNGFLKSRKIDKKILFSKSIEIVENSKLLQNKDYDDLILEFRKIFHENNDTEKLLTYLCEISSRVLGKRPYNVQVMGMLIIQNGSIAEMATGEGKTLTASIAAVMFASEKKPVHVLTSNDYLAERDAEESKPLFEACGLSVGFIGSEIQPPERKKIYEKDIVYTTAKELLTDYLKDRIKLKRDVGDLQRAIEYSLHLNDRANYELTMRGLHAVIVDEADNILIDEAVIPLIISATRDNIPLKEAAVRAFDCTKELKKDVDYQIDIRLKIISWTTVGNNKIKDISQKLPLMWRGSKRSKELLETAIYAREFLKNGEHYIISEGKLVLIDSLTGRLMPQRNLGINLQQAVEAKEGVEISDPTETIGRMSFQRFFRLFPKIGGMSGTVKEVRKEIWQIYHTLVVEVPTYRPIRRKELPWNFFKNEKQKIDALVENLIERNKKGQPILLGTRSVETSELIAEKFSGRVEQFNILNAVRHKDEADIVAMAGVSGAFTIATNMAGRGTDIKLGEGVHELGGLYVACAEPQSSRRLDRQLIGRSGRQGDPGEAEIYVSLDDVIIRTFLPKWLKLPVRMLFSINNSLSNYLLKKIIISLQGRSENNFAQQRLAILNSDDWIEKYLTFPEPYNNFKN